MNGERKVFRITVILAFLVAASFLAFAWACVPRYEGKSIGYWFYTFRQECFPSQSPRSSPRPGYLAFATKPSPASLASDKAMTALRALDSEAALYLVQRLQPQKGRFWDFYGKHYSRIPSALKPILPPPPNDPIVQQAAMLALIELRESARSAIPSMIQMIADTSLPAYSRVKEDAIQMLIAARPSMTEIDRLIAELSRNLDYSQVKALISELDLSTPGTVMTLAGMLLMNDSDSWAIRRLEKMGTQAKPAIPFLITNLSNPSSIKRARSIRVLGIIGTNATEAFDEVKRCYFRDPDPGVRVADFHALSRIDSDKANVMSETVSPP